MRKLTTTLTGLTLALSAGLAQADICLTFGSSTDLFRGNVTGFAAGGFLGLAMIEDTFDRATFGSMKLEAGKLRIALTKNTNTAVVSYACQIDPVQLSGPCQIQIVIADPLSGSRTDDVGFFELACTTPAGRDVERRALPAGESR